MRDRVIAYVALGSNLGDRAAHLEAAVRGLGDTPGVVVRGRSSVYETDAVGPGEQPAYLNAVVCIETELPARALLERLLAIEATAGRVRRERWGARTLDCDLLLYGDAQLAEEGLIVPHPRMRERPFVLEPLAELAPDLRHPECGEPVSVLAARVRDERAVRRAGSPARREHS